MKTTETIKIPWLLGIIGLPVLMAGTILFAVVTSVIMSIVYIPFALMGKLTFTVTHGKEA